jgi:ligand-binding sensor domain-containing protein
MAGDECVTGPALDADLVYLMVEDASGKLWIGATRAIWSLRDRLVQVKGLRARTPGSIVAAAPGVLVDAADGVYRIDSDSAVKVRPFSANPGLRLWADADAIWNVAGQEVLRDGERVFTLPDRRQISTALFDREGSLWLGTDSDGLHRLKAALFTTWSVAEGVAHQNVYATYVDRSGAIWLGTWGKGVSRIDPATGRVTAPLSGAIPGSVIPSTIARAPGGLRPLSTKVESRVVPHPRCGAAPPPA